MEQKTTHDIAAMAQAARGKINKIYLHWTAGRYDQQFEAYHINIGAAGEIYASTNDLAELKSHTWLRNTGAVGVTLCACYGATVEGARAGDFGAYPPTPAMIDGMARVVAVLAKGLGLPIDRSAVLTHCEIAIIDGYGPYSGDPETRWDLLYLPDSPGDGLIKDGGDVIRGKAIWWQEEG